ncbi:MAG: purine-nucleoside phosphorylase [Marinifilaceae bacterium]|jgi:purine-nucleoside phosphorylase|nr:purine-nucleoside phosphorylase [Marinifilaceae bacterium]
MLQKIKKCASYINERISIDTDTGIILGTGLGKLAEQIDIIHKIKYEDLPHFPISTVEGHNGQFIYGKLGNKYVIALQGRFHYYEGYSMEEVGFPVRVLKELGVNRLLISNAAGAMNPSYEVGDLVIIKDHINMFPTNPLIGKNHEELGPRFPDMSEAYDKEMIIEAQKIAKRENIDIHTGVYVGVSGPTYETPAEYKFFRIIGGDIVGMSTVPEVIVARHAGIKCFGISVVTDSGAPGKLKEISHSEVQRIGELSQPRMAEIFKKII